MNRIFSCIRQSTTNQVANTGTPVQTGGTAPKKNSNDDVASENDLNKAFYTDHDNISNGTPLSCHEHSSRYQTNRRGILKISIASDQVNTSSKENAKIKTTESPRSYKVAAKCQQKLATEFSIKEAQDLARIVKKIELKKYPEKFESAETTKNKNTKLSNFFSYISPNQFKYSETTADILGHYGQYQRAVADQCKKLQQNQPRERTIKNADLNRYFYHNHAAVDKRDWADPEHAAQEYGDVSPDCKPSTALPSSAGSPLKKGTETGNLNFYLSKSPKTTFKKRDELKESGSTSSEKKQQDKVSTKVTELSQEKEVDKKARQIKRLKGMHEMSRRGAANMTALFKALNENDVSQQQRARDKAYRTNNQALIEQVLKNSFYPPNHDTTTIRSVHRQKLQVQQLNMLMKQNPERYRAGVSPYQSPSRLKE